MTALTVEQRDELAERLASTVMPWLTYAVHTRDAATVEAFLTGLDRQELVALAVVLAARCPQPLVRPDDGIVDEIAIARACAGEPVPLTRVERLEAVRILHGRGYSNSEIGRRLHLAGSTTKHLVDKLNAGQEVA